MVWQLPEAVAVAIAAAITPRAAMVVATVAASNRKAYIVHSSAELLSLPRTMRRGKVHLCIYKRRKNVVGVTVRGTSRECKL